jgi:hypothetical protein
VDLAQAYESALYEVLFPAGPVTFEVGEAELPGPYEAQSLTVVTAYNPGTQRPTLQENEAANARLRQRIERAGWRWFPAAGYDPGRIHEEPSFAVLGLSEEEALALSAEFRQVAVLYVSAGRARLLWT